MATGGSGHAFKFLPVIGDCIVECVVGRTPQDFKGKWEWPAERLPEEMWEGDGSRGGPMGMVLEEEEAKWEWPAERVPEEMWEGEVSRGGPIGMVLEKEDAKLRWSKL